MTLRSDELRSSRKCERRPRGQEPAWSLGSRSGKRRRKEGEREGGEGGSGGRREHPGASVTRTPEREPGEQCGHRKRRASRVWDAPCSRGRILESTRRRDRL